MPTNSIALRSRRELTLVQRHPRIRVDRRLLRRILRAALADPVFSRPAPEAVPRRGRRAFRVRTPRSGASDSPRARICYELGCFLVGADEMTALNGRYLAHAGVTDVIAFDYGPPPGARPGDPWLCGEVFVCLDEAGLQARRYRTTWTSELVRYLLHGLLHLRGYDDVKPGWRRRMKRIEGRLVREMRSKFDLTRLGLPAVRATRRGAHRRRDPQAARPTPASTRPGARP